MTTFPYYSEQSFMQLLSDAIYFYKASVETDHKYDIQRFSRSSIVNSILSIEAAANCCLYQLKSSKPFTEEIEKTTSFAKLDLFVKIQNEKFIDRGCSQYQKVKELKKIRDSLVHPKKLKIPVKLSLDNGKNENYANLGINFDIEQYPATQIHKSPAFWFSGDAKAALEAIFEFYSYYFIDLLNLKHEEVLGLLGSGIFMNDDNFISFHAKPLIDDLAYLDTIGIKNRFIDLKSVPQLNTPQPL